MDAVDPRRLLRRGREDPDPDPGGRPDLRRRQFAALREDRDNPAHGVAVTDRIRRDLRGDDLSHEVTLLDVYGTLLLAGARTLQTRLPDPTGSEQPVVVLRLRGRTTLGATAFIVLADYSDRLRAAGGYLFLSGVQPDLHQQLRDAHRVELQDAVTVIPASDSIFESTQKALDNAEAWLVVHASSARTDDS